MKLRASGSCEPGAGAASEPVPHRQWLATHSGVASRSEAPWRAMRVHRASSCEKGPNCAAQDQQSEARVQARLQGLRTGPGEGRTTLTAPAAVISAASTCVSGSLAVGRLPGGAEAAQGSAPPKNTRSGMRGPVARSDARRSCMGPTAAGSTGGSGGAANGDSAGMRRVGEPTLPSLRPAPSER